MIAALNEMPDHPATLSLARHAVWSPFPEARSAARGFLKSRDQNVYLPALLEELRGPLLAYRQFVTDGVNHLISRYALVLIRRRKFT